MLIIIGNIIVCESCVGVEKKQSSDYYRLCHICLMKCVFPVVQGFRLQNCETFLFFVPCWIRFCEMSVACSVVWIDCSCRLTSIVLAAEEWCTPALTHYEGRNKRLCLFRLVSILTWCVQVIWNVLFICIWGFLIL